MYEYLEEINEAELIILKQYEGYELANQILSVHKDPEALEKADIVIIGITDQRGQAGNLPDSNAPHAIRQQLYALQHWHTNLTIADAGNIITGSSLADTRYALTQVLQHIHQKNKIALVLGTTHDQTYYQYQALAQQHNKLINLCVADALIDLAETEHIQAHSFLMPLLTQNPNYISHYTHIGFQSYYAHPKILTTLDKLGFSCIRLGKARADLLALEPLLRQADIFSIDMNCLKHADAPHEGAISPNGFTGDEACQLTQYAGMSSNLQSIGIYNYQPQNDYRSNTAKQIAQMIWYFFDGVVKRKTESPINIENNFLEFHTVFSDYSITFKKSKITNRWWLQIPSQQWVPCAYTDYILATQNELPEPYLRSI